MNNRHRGTMVVGVVLIILGILFLLSNFGIFEIYFDIFDIGFLFAHFWPMFLIIPGVFSIMHTLRQKHLMQACWYQEVFYL